MKHEGRLEEALEYLERAVEADPKFAAAYLERAEAYDSLGRSDAAAADYREAIKLQPDCSEAYNNLAMMYSDRGRTRRCDQVVRKGT